MKLKLLSLSIIMLLSAPILNAQKWMEMMYDPTVNFYETQREFYAYWKNRKVTKGSGWKVFKRWEYMMQSRVDANGKLPPANYLQQQLQNYQLTHMNAKRASSVANWTPVGPNSAVGLEDGIGRVQCFAIDPDSPNTYWAGTPGGGLWKSTDAGASWVPKTDDLVSLGISWILIDPTNSNIMYVATGDCDGEHSRSTGVMKSTDGGDTWAQTGLNFTGDSYEQIYQLRFLPGNSAVLLAAGRAGIYRSSNSGDDWSWAPVGTTYDLEFHPTIPSTVYASGHGKLLKSVDGGVNWSELTTGLPASWQRSAVEVTANAPDQVYFLITDNFKYKAIYKSTNAGLSFTNLNVNLDLGGQILYDLTLKVNPSNPNLIYAGGVKLFKSEDGGVTWSDTTRIHVDHHNLFFLANKLFVCNDGGLYRLTEQGGNPELLHGNMQIMQFYRISSHIYDENYMIGGAQDNGTSRFRNNLWKRIEGGDGMDNAISNQDRNVVWASIQNGELYKSTNGGDLVTIVNNNISESGPWVTPFLLNPDNHDNVYAGFRNLWKTTTGGNSWEKISNLDTIYTIQHLLVDWQNKDKIYITRFTDILKTVDGGANWTNIGANIGENIGMGVPITMDPENTDHIWVAGGGVNVPRKIFNSVDGGQSWTDITGTLPAVPVNTITYVPGSNEGIYLGSDIGVFYKDASMSDWIYFNEGLPHVKILDIDLNLGAGKIRVATFGRGIWESALHPDANSKPVVDFTASAQGGCPGSVISFSDYTYNATSLLWTFEGGTPATSTSLSPTVTYATPGTFDVTLAATNANGVTTKVKSNLLTISGQVISTFPYQENFDSQTVGSTNFSNGWENAVDDDDNWFVHTGKAPVRTGTNPKKAGPVSDHTSGQGNYLLVESTVENQYKWVSIYSPCFNLNNVPNPILEYYEHVYGSTYDGELHLDVLVNGNWQQDVAPVVNQIGDIWLKKTVDLSSYGNQTIRLRFRALAASQAKDFALDDVRVSAKQAIAPVADFITPVTSDIVEFTTTFYDQSANIPTSYNWSFPGGNPPSSTAINPEVSYATAGQYNVSLTVSNPYGSHSITKTAYINARGAEYIINNQTVTGCEGRVYDTGGKNGDYGNNEQVSFTIAPVGAEQVIINFSEWGLIGADKVAFYDGNSTSSPLIGSYGGFGNPGTIKANSGALTFQFISDALGVSAGFKGEWSAIGGINCSPGTIVIPPVAAFISDTNFAEAPATFYLTDVSQNKPSGRTWLLPGAYNERNYDSLTYANYDNPGTYTVSLIAVNEGGRDTLIKPAYFTVTTPPAELNMQNGTQTACKGTLYDDGGPTGNYGNQKQYTLVIQPSGATSVTINFSQWAVQNTSDVLRIYNGTSVTAPLLGTWSGTSPGTVTANSGALTLRFTSNATVNAAGWKATWTSTGGICTPPEKPVADFSTTTTTVAIGTAVQFTDLSTNTPTTWNWTFTGGNPSSAAVKNPVVSYATAGTYTVSLTAANAVGAATKTKTNYITVTPAAINMKNGTVTSCTGTLYDDGGPNSNYLNQKQYTLVIQPGGATAVTINFSQWGVENTYDQLKIYNGPSVTAPLLGTWSGTSPGTVTANSGSMTLRFTSDANTTGIGWKATWSAIGGSCTTSPIHLAVKSANETITDNTGVTIFPNPNAGEFTVQMNKKYEQLIITNITGAIIQKQSVQQQRMKLDLTDQVPGIYFIQFIGSEGIKTEKVIIQ